MKRDFKDLSNKFENNEFSRNLYASHYQEQNKHETQTNNLQEKLTDITKKYIQVESMLKEKENTLNDLLLPGSANKNCQLKKKIFSNVVKEKKAAASNGIIYAHNAKGRPQALAIISKPESGSAIASSRTIRERSRKLETITRFSTTSGKPENQDDLIKQQASLIRRNTETFLQSAKQAGLKVITKFKIEDVVSLKAEMPMEHVRFLKRAFKENFGFDVFGSEKQIREKMSKYELPFESGTYQTVGDNPKTVNFVRITQVDDVMNMVIKELDEAKLLENLPGLPNNELYVLLTGDKGGSSTKVMLQILNTKSGQSVRSAKLIGIYEGEKDNRECVEAIFSNIIPSVQDFANNIKDKNIKCPPPTRFKEINDSHDFLSIKGTSNLPIGLCNMDPKNKIFSVECTLGRHGKGSLNLNNTVTHDHNTNQPQTTNTEKLSSVDPAKEKEQIYETCHVVLGGDWMWLTIILGLTGPNGLFFCKDCLVKISDTGKGMTHTPYPLAKYSNSVPSVITFPVRTFESLTDEAKKFKADGSNKSNVSSYKNCEYEPLFKTNGPVLQHTSCMPVHLNLGIGL